MPDDAPTRSMPDPTDEASQGAALLAEFMGALRTSPTPRQSHVPTKNRQQQLLVPTEAPTITNVAARVWKSRRAKFSHLPPITIKLVHAQARAEVRVDAVARCGDLVRDLAVGGPSDTLYSQLNLGQPPRRGTPRQGASLGAASGRVVGLRRKAAHDMMHPRDALEEGGDYVLVIDSGRDLADDAARALVAGTAAALGVAEDSSDWSDNEDVEPLQ